MPFPGVVADEVVALAGQFLQAVSLAAALSPTSFMHNLLFDGKTAAILYSSRLIPSRVALFYFRKSGPV